LPIGRWETRVGVGQVGRGWATKAEWADYCCRAGGGKRKGKKWKAKRSFGLKLEIKYKRAVEFWSSNRFKDFDQKQRGLNISKPKFQLDFKIE
jgi:hypothetical protein